MNYSTFKQSLVAVATAGILTSCGSGFTIVSPPIENIDSTPIKTTDLTEKQIQNWKDYDLVTDTIPGMSVNKAYAEILPEHNGIPVIVAVIDSGIDVEHEDLDDKLWTNPKEIPNNGIDDDKNGYIDDIHGWNFLGDIIDENLEYERIVRDKAILPADLVAKAQKEYDEKLAEAEKQKQFFESQLQTINNAEKSLQEYLNKEDFTLEDVKAIEAGENETLNISQQIAIQVISNYENFGNVRKLITDEINKKVNILNGKNLKTNYRKDALPGNSPYKYTVGEIWGNNDYDGPDPKKEDAFHGTHVAGIIAAERNNGLGVNGVSENAQIMVLRAVSTGDEYDKDIAAAIRYAADNGAKVINTSFGKYHSSNPEWVWDAIKYAASKDVLIVNAAGNDGITTDEIQVYPQDQIEAGDEIVDNFLTVGAMAPKYGSDIVASFSNYGNSTVDIFAPGVQIYSTTPLNKYRNASGTSMASPAVAGIAAVIRSHFPKLSAAQVKQVIMDSGLPSMANVSVGGKTKAFSEISKSGKMANLYNALILASKMK